MGGKLHTHRHPVHQAGPGLEGNTRLEAGLRLALGVPAVPATPNLPVYFLFFMLVVYVWGGGWVKRHLDSRRENRQKRVVD